MGNCRFPIADCRLRERKGRSRSVSSLSNRQSAFTLIELLVVISIMAILAGILLPAISAVRTAAKNTSTKALIERLGVALSHYEKDMGCLPPDFVASGAVTLLAFPGYAAPILPALPPEAVYYFLANANATNGAPYFNAMRGSETVDYNLNRLPEVVDAWGRPILYNRGRFPGATTYTFNYGGPLYEAPDGKPWHNKETFDLYSVGIDATTGGWNGESGRPKPLDPGANLPAFCDKTMKAYGYTGSGEASGPSCGNESDDICNWK